MDDIHIMDEELRSIRLDASDSPKVQPLRLDKMFLRAGQWKTTSTPSPVIRPPSPPRRGAIFPLPKPLEGRSVSPLAGLFGYAELVPHVLEWFEHPRDLAVLCRVSKEFCAIARRKLYESIWVRPCEWLDIAMEAN
jgi:hypothetical protein